MAARDVHIHRGRAEAAHAAASGQIERLQQVGKALDSACRALSSRRTVVSELGTALAGHLADLRPAAWDPPQTRAHRY